MSAMYVITVWVCAATSASYACARLISIPFGRMAISEFCAYASRKQEASDVAAAQVTRALFFLSSFVFLCQAKHVFCVLRRHNFLTIHSNR